MYMASVSPHACIYASLRWSARIPSLSLSLVFSIIIKRDNSLDTVRNCLNVSTFHGCCQIPGLISFWLTNFPPIPLLITCPRLREINRPFSRISADYALCWENRKQCDIKIRKYITRKLYRENWVLYQTSRSKIFFFFISLNKFPILIAAALDQTKSIFLNAIR